MRFKKLRLSVAIALLLFVILVGSIIAFGLFRSQQSDLVAISNTTKKPIVTLNSTTQSTSSTISNTQTVPDSSNVIPQTAPVNSNIRTRAS